MAAQNSSLLEKNNYTHQDILRFKPYTQGTDGNIASALKHSQARVKGAGVWHDRQILGRRYPIGRVTFEVTQRCNLDCTLCYLSENSESVKDVPIEEVFRRIDLIKDHYGRGTDLQITGGDSTLMTHGLKATRSLLGRLIGVGLKDVAFHVDLTQERKPFKNEMELNKVGKIYIERVQGLPICLTFNMTSFKENFHEIPSLIEFFCENSDRFQFASFQLQADTGRGELRKRDDLISMDAVWEQIEKGAKVKLPFEAIQIGHGDCNRYFFSLTANGKIYPILDSPEFIQEFMHAPEGLVLGRTNNWKLAKNLGGWMLKNPKPVKKGLFGFVFAKVFKMSKDLLASLGKMGRLTFFVPNVMDASQLECDRIDSCSFRGVTTEGPISLCMHNAKRDAFILKPFQAKHGGIKEDWNPVNGRVHA